MITVLVVEEERKVYELLFQALKKEGYSFVDEPESGGVIKIIKRTDAAPQTYLRGKVLALKNSLLGQHSGEVYKETLREIEKGLIEAALERTDGNQLKAARILGINRNTLAAKIRKFAVEKKSEERTGLVNNNREQET